MKPMPPTEGERSELDAFLDDLAALPDKRAEQIAQAKWRALLAAAKNPPPWDFRNEEGEKRFKQWALKALSRVRFYWLDDEQYEQLRANPDLYHEHELYHELLVQTDRAQASLREQRRHPTARLLWEKLKELLVDDGELQLEILENVRNLRRGRGRKKGDQRKGQQPLTREQRRVREAALYDERFFQLLFKIAYPDKPERRDPPTARYIAARLHGLKEADLIDYIKKGGRPKGPRARAGT